MPPPGGGGRKVGVFRGGAGKFCDGVLGGGRAEVAVSGARGGGRKGGGRKGGKNPGGGIPGGRAGKLTAPGARGKDGAKLGGGRRGTGAIENGVLDARGGIVCGRRATSAGVSCIKPTEPGRFFDELPP